MKIKNIGFLVLILMPMAMHAMNLMHFSPATMQFSPDFVAKYTRPSKTIEGEENYEFISPTTIEQALDGAKAAERRAQEAKTNHERNSYLAAEYYFALKLKVFEHSKTQAKARATILQKDAEILYLKQHLKDVVEAAQAGLASDTPKVKETTASKMHVDAKEAAEYFAKIHRPQSSDKPSSSLNNKGPSDD